MAALSQSPILEAWEKTLQRRAGDSAILDCAGLTLRTFDEIRADAERLASLIRENAAGEVIAVQIGNSLLLPGLLLALWEKGCVPVLLDRSIEGVSRESALETSGASALISNANALNDSSADLVATRRHGRPAPAGTDFLKLTSGTSSAPRAIRFTAAQLLTDCENICATMGITDRDLNYGVIPWSHSYGFSNLITPLLCGGIPLVATEDRLPRAILSGMTASGATVFPGVPVFYQKLAELSGAHPEKLRLCISAGAPLPEATAAAFRSRFGLKVHGFYGSSECGGITYDRSDDDVPEGCVGEPMDGVELRHDEHSGRIVVSSSAVGIDYYPEPDSEILGSGSFTPGDLLRHTSKGFVIAGRVSDFINIAGRKLNPVEVEQTLREVPGVEEALVFGVPHPIRGEEPIACVVGSASSETLESYCAAKLAAWQMPRDIWRVGALPVNERGKCSRRAVADLYLTHIRARKR